MTAHEPYRRAAGSDFGMRHYDLMARLMMRERRIKGRALDLAQLAPGKRLLDLGCGTGTLLLMARRRWPSATVIGIDGDPAILAVARQKARQAGIPVQLDQGSALALPYADGTFDAVVSTFAFHHLAPNQQQALAEAQRVLRHSGRLVIVDFAPPHNRLMRLLQRFPLWGRQRHGSAAGGHAAHAGQRDERGALSVAHRLGRAGNNTPPHQQMVRVVELDELLRSNGWRRVAPTERFMSAMGTIALNAFSRPN